MKLLLDTGVLGRICHPRKHAEVRAWYPRACEHHELLLSVVVDYELRRSLLRIRSRRSIAWLDEMNTAYRVIGTTPATWQAAAELWAKLRRAGRVTGREGSLDADLLIAVQAIEEGAVVVTYNLRHFEGVVEAVAWSDVPLG